MHIRLTMKGTIWDPPKFIVPKNCSVFEMLRFSEVILKFQISCYLRYYLGLKGR
ncbi:unnamed protein product [Brassica napus]|uniref:(rape) hypothetical protein n=1 Tax=Brassica napus TaxID=3708 RepID=A0A817AFV2_BRANA|nr:unnamed protein product [Brassica napus]